MTILTTICEQIATAIETERLAAGFTLNDFITDWDFEGRAKDPELTDERLHVRVIVPRKWETAKRIDRSATLEYIGAFDIDVRQTFGISDQSADNDIERDRLTALVGLVEEIHLLMHTDPPADDEYNLQWLAEYDGSKKQSEILASYMVNELRKNRMFYGVCRELFQVTQ